MQMNMLRLCPKCCARECPPDRTVCEKCYPRDQTVPREVADRLAALLIRYRDATPVNYQSLGIMDEVTYALANYRAAVHHYQYDGPTEGIEDVMCVACGGTGEAPDNGTNMGECDECCGSGLMA